MRHEEIDKSGAAKFRRIALFHVPKTAGTTLGETMRKWFSDDEVWLQPNSQDYVGFREGVESGALRFVSGHLRPTLHGDYFGSEWLKVLLLRSPLTHIPSQFYHFKQAHNHDAEQNRNLVTRANEMDLATFLRSGGSNGDFCPLFDNPQIRFILNLRNETLTNAHVDEAIAVLSDFDVVGVRERLLQTAHIAASKFGKSPPQKLPRLRTGGANNPFHIETAPRSAVMAILERTRFDDQLYRWAWTRLDRQGNELTDNMSLAAPKASQVRPIMLSDVFMDDRRRVRNLIWGVDGMTMGDQIFLHPPSPDLGRADLWMSNVEISGQQQMSAEVQLPDANAPDVIFGFSIFSGEQRIAETQVRIAAGQRAELKTRIPPIFGRATVHLATEIAPGWDRNTYATAIFHNARIE